ncbi:hypothetical protein HK098_003471, partial [Nowakowskiella sp. JEL0407]
MPDSYNMANTKDSYESIAPTETTPLTTGSSIVQISGTNHSLPIPNPHDDHEHG